MSSKVRRRDMIYACNNCGFLFSRVSEISVCPACENRSIRPATEEEGEKLKIFLEERKKDEQNKLPIAYKSQNIVYADFELKREAEE